MIELMIVLAIVGLLLTVALPSFERYSIKARINHGIAAAYAQSADVESVYSEEGEFPVSIALYDLPGSETAQIKWWTRSDRQATRIEVWLGGDLYEGAHDNVMILLEGIPDGFGNVNWECVKHPTATAWHVAAQYLPDECDNNARAVY